MTGRRILTAALLAVALGGGIFFSACGGDEGDRERKTCERCDTHVDQGCFHECQELCGADPSCDTRCAAQCDECRRDLVCSACRGTCTDDAFRCAPTNETVQCDEGVYGGAP
jgi:hypothetical protein